MSWLYFSILASAVYAICNFIDKYILEKRIKDYRGLVVYTALVGFIFGIGYWAFSGFSVLPTQDALLIILTGILTIWGLAFYLRSLALEETSTVIILMQMVPVITLVLSFFFLHEKISSIQMFGFVLILFAVVGVSLKKEDLHMRLSLALLFILLADLCWAIANIIFKFVVSSANFSQLIAYESFGIALGGLLLYLFYPSVRNAFHNQSKSLSKITIGIILINESIFLLAKLLGYYAISLGSVTLVGIVSSTQVFFGIFYGWILTLLYRNTYREDISFFGISKKIILALVVFGGIWLILY